MITKIDFIILIVKFIYSFGHKFRNAVGSDFVKDFYSAVSEDFSAAVNSMENERKAIRF
jgi:hypothetical protein